MVIDYVRSFADAFQDANFLILGVRRKQRRDRYRRLFIRWVTKAAKSIN
jgi:hypothetical protein